MRAALYARVSTVDKQNVDLQLRDLRSYAQARGFNILLEYIDIGESGAKDKRPELCKLMDDARKRRIDLILVWRLDRFGRSLKHLINTLDELKGLGISFVSYSENIDLSTPTGQLMFHMLGAFAQFERELIRERVMAGLSCAKVKGRILGRPKRYIDIEEMNRLKKQGLGIKKIAKALNLSVGLVHKTLRNLPLSDVDK